MQSGVTMPTDKTPELLAAIQRLTTADVLVGIPASNAGRSGEVTNASLAYIHEYGSPAKNIPARPFMRPGIYKARDKIGALMRRGAQQAIKSGDQQAVDQTLEKVGMVARNSVVEAILDPSPPFVPLKPATIRARLRRTQAGRRQLKKFQREATQAGVKTSQVISDWAGQGNIKPLIDTGQMKNAITYVVRHGVVPFTKALTAYGYQRDFGKIFTK